MSLCTQHIPTSVFFIHILFVSYEPDNIWTNNTEHPVGATEKLTDPMIFSSSCILEIRVYQFVKSLKVYVFRPDSHSLGQTYYKNLKNAKIKAYLGVAHPLQRFSTSIFCKNSSQNSFCLKIIVPNLQMIQTFNIFH